LQGTDGAVATNHRAAEGGFGRRRQGHALEGGLSPDLACLGVWVSES